MATEKLKDFFKQFKKIQMPIQTILLLVTIFLIVLAEIFGFNFVSDILLAPVLFCSFVFGWFTVEFLVGKKAWCQYVMMMASCSMILGYYVSLILFAITKNFFSDFNTVHENYGLAFRIVFTILGAVITGLLFFPLTPRKTKAEDRKRIEGIVFDTKYKDKEGLGYGDTMLGTVLETGKPNRIPYKDRFLHTFVLGPTGSGKTSQSLTPMVARDVNYKDIGIVCLEPKGDFAEMVYALAIKAGRPKEDVVYFNPILKNCPYFNPLVGPEDDVCENIVTTFSTLENEKQVYFKNMDENLMRRCLKVVKRLYGDDATLLMIDTLMNNYNNDGKRMLRELRDNQDFEPGVVQENSDIYSWFVNDYYTQLSGDRPATKTFEQCAGVRNQVSKLLANKTLRRILNPPKASELKEGEYVNFSKILNEGGVLTMCSAQGELRELSSFLGFFLIYSFESAVFRRPGNENTRKGVVFYVDEFQKYANEGYADLLTQGRSYRVASVLATQTRSGIAINAGPLGNMLTDLISTNARNKIIYPGGSEEDAEYYSKEFGTYEKRQENVSHSINGANTFFAGIDASRNSTSISTQIVTEAIFKPVDIRQRAFGQAVSQVVRNNTLQDAVVVELSWIPGDLKKWCDDYIEKNIRPMEKGNVYADVIDQQAQPEAPKEKEEAAHASDIDELPEVNSPSSDDDLFDFSDDGADYTFTL